MRAVAWTAVTATACWLLGFAIAELEYRWQLWRMKKRVDRAMRRKA